MSTPEGVPDGFLTAKNGQAHGPHVAGLAGRHNGTETGLWFFRHQALPHCEDTERLTYLSYTYTK